MRFLLAITCVLYVLPSFALAEGDEPGWQFKSEKAAAAVKKFQAQKRELQKAYREDLKNLRAELAKSLEELLKAKGDEAAGSLRGAIGALQANREPGAQSLLKDGVYLAAEFDSIWTHEYHVDGDDIRLVQVIHDEGAKHKVGWVGKIKPLEANTVAIFWTLPNGKKSRDVWGVAENRINIQHWPIGVDPADPAPHHLIADVKKDDVKKDDDKKEGQE